MVRFWTIEIIEGYSRICIKNIVADDWHKAAAIVFEFLGIDDNYEYEELVAIEQLERE